MSTAGRATYNPAIAKSHKEGGPISQQFSAKDVKGQTKIKYRQTGQGTKEELQQKNLRRNLEEKEFKPLVQAEDDEDSSSDEEEKSEEKDQSESKSTEQAKATNLDADDSDDSDSDDSSKDEKESDSEDEDEEDDTAELMRELEKIKREREAEAARREMENLAYQKAEQEEQLLTSNPIIAKERGVEDFNIKKRWYDDSIFKNQTKGEQKVQKRFINDTIRNDFHRKFMSKYIQ